jgi:hypothetical protein
VLWGNSGGYHCEGAKKRRKKKKTWRQRKRKKVCTRGCTGPAV